MEQHFFLNRKLPLEKSVTIGGGSFASLRARASSQKPRKILRQKIQKWARIWYLFRPIQTLLHAGCFHYASQTDRSETSGNDQGKWNDIFRSNRAERNGSYHFFKISFPNSQHKWGEVGLSKTCKNGTAKFRADRFDRNKWTTSRSDPEYFGRKEPKRTFPFDFRPKFPESLA